ncbi:MAG TPA: ABC transporter permease [Gemmatimonadaceae bacterium]|jgi:predicted permease
MSERWNLRRVFRVPGSAKQTRADVDAELVFHIQGRIEELVASGMSRDDATREAQRRFGDLARIEAEVERLDRDRQRRRSLYDRVSTLISDVRFAARSVARQPLFALVVVATMTLGVGTTAAIFHAVDRIVLHPLPYPDADRIVYLGMQRKQGLDIGAVTARRFQFWHDQSRIFEGLATSVSFDATLDGSEGDVVVGTRVSPDYLDVIGARPALGRLLFGDDYAASAAPVAIISDGLWKRKFGADHNAIGKSVRLDSTRYTVVGVLPSAFEIAEEKDAPDVLLPLVLSAQQLESGGANYTAIGKVRGNVSQTQINADMAAVFARFRELYPKEVDDDDRGVAVIGFTRMAGASIEKTLWIFLGATAFVFLLACANVVNIVLARAIGRQREFAVRTALGAGRARIVRQILLEMLVLGVASAVCATAASLLTVRWISTLGIQLFIRESQLRLDWRVVAYVTIVATTASVVIGGIVAMMTTRIDLSNGLSASTRGSGVGDRRGTLRAALVSVEAALAMVLLAGAGLLVASFAHVLQVDGGFRRQGVYTAHVSRTPRSYFVNEDAAYQFDERVLAQLRATPGVQEAAATATLPLKRGWNTPTTVEGHDDATYGGTEWRGVSPGYFRAMDITLLSGRDFAETDTRTSPPVVIVSKAYASKMFPDENPIGRRIYLGVYKGRGKEKTTASEIVGVVADLRDRSLDQTQLRQTVWVSHTQVKGMKFGLSSFVVRANDPVLAANALRRAIADADPSLPVADVASMNDIVLQSLGPRRFTTVLLTTFALIALALTCVGIYGVASYSVSQRTREIGVRIALGAQPSSVVGLVVRQGIRPAMIGLGVGVVLALGVSKVIASMLFGVGPRDPLSLSVVAALLAAVAVTATWLPARRASRVDPVQALRAE